jgi:hypothetical protein
VEEGEQEVGRMVGIIPAAGGSEADYSGSGTRTCVTVTLTLDGILEYPKLHWYEAPQAGEEAGGI